MLQMSSLFCSFFFFCSLFKSIIIIIINSNKSQEKQIVKYLRDTNWFSATLRRRETCGENKTKSQLMSLAGEFAVSGPAHERGDDLKQTKTEKKKRKKSQHATEFYHHRYGTDYSEQFLVLSSHHQACWYYSLTWHCI